MRFLFQKINFDNQFYQTWYRIFTMAALFAALDSLIVLFNPLKTAFLGLEMPLTIARILAFCLCFIYLYVVDYGLSVFLPTSIQTVITSYRDKIKDKALWSIAVLTLVFCVAQIAMTVGVSLYLRHPSAKMSIAKPVLKDPSILFTGVDNGILSIETSLTTLKSEKQTAIENSQKNRELLKLRDNGNGWAASELRAKAKVAATPFDKRIEKLESEKVSVLNAKNTNIKTALASISQSNNFEIKSYDEASQTLADFLLYFAIGATIIECFSGLMLGLYRAFYKIGGLKSMTPTPLGNSTNGGNDTVITGNYQPRGLIYYNDKWYEYGQIKRWWQNTNKRINKAENERKVHFIQLAARLKRLLDEYDAKKIAAI